MANFPNILYDRPMESHESKSKSQKIDTEELITSALSKKLSQSVEERIDSHENARQLINDLSNAAKDTGARPQEAS